MFENRLFEIGGCGLKHIDYISNVFCESYKAVTEDEKQVMLFLANDYFQRKQMEKIKEYINNTPDWKTIINEEKTSNIEYLLVENCNNQKFPFEKICALEERKVEVKIIDECIANLISRAPYLDFTYNRLDVKYGDNYKVICLSEDGEDVYIPYYKKGNRAFLAVSMSPLSTRKLDILLDWMWKSSREITNIDMVFSLAYNKQLRPRNNYQIYFNGSNEDILLRLNSKSRYNYNRELKTLERYIGTINIEEYEKKQISDKLVYKYFEMKKKTHNRDYGLTPKEYVELYDISNAYVLYHDRKEIGILFSCENSEIAYLENFSYDIDYEKFSVGKIMYYEFLKVITKKGKRGLYLAGGNYQYKKHFFSENSLCFSGTISRSDEEREDTNMLY